MLLNNPTHCLPTNTIIYIMGDGRCGSTIFSVLLGNHSKIQTVGEIDKWPKFTGKTKEGANKQSDLLFWEEILTHYNDQSRTTSFKEIEDVHNNIEQYTYFFRTILKRTPSWMVELYHDHTHRLITSICSTSGKDIIVDSSKNMGRGWMLLRNPYLNTKVIHLVRDPKATMYSMMKKNIEQKTKSPFLSMVHYNIKNIFCMFVKLTSPKGSVLRVRYESLVFNPKTELQRIGKFLQLNMDELINMIEKQQPLLIPPLLDGNRIRQKKSILLRYDNSWETRLPTYLKAIAIFLTFPLSLLFGYLRKEES